MRSKKKLDINDAKSKMITKTSGLELLGLPIDASSAQNDELSRKLWDTHFPFLWCLCVQDSPDNPCPCTGPIVWVPRTAILRSEALNRTSEDGRVIERLEIRRETELVVDMVTHITVERFLNEQHPHRSINTTHHLCSDLLIPAPAETTQESGILWYKLQVNESAKSVAIFAFNSEGGEVGQHITYQTGKNAFSFTVEQEAAKVKGEIELFSEGRSGVTIQGTINEESIDINYRQGNSTSCKAEEERPVCLNRAQLQLLTEWGRISQPVMALASASDSRKARRSCFGCLVLLAGVSVGAGCCVAGNPACCAATGIGGSSFIDDCGGACA